MFLWIKIFAGGDKSTKTTNFLPAKLSSHTVLFSFATYVALLWPK